MSPMGDPYSISPTKYRWTALDPFLCQKLLVERALDAPGRLPNGRSSGDGFQAAWTAASMALRLFRNANWIS